MYIKIFDKFLRQKSGWVWNEFVIPEHLFTEDVALMVTDIDVHNIITSYKFQCQIFIHSGNFMTQSTSSFAYQKDFALREVIDYHLLKFEQSGLLDRLMDKYFTKPLSDCQQPIRELGFQATFLCFAILVIGIVIAMASSVVERYSFCRSLRVYLQE